MHLVDDAKQRESGEPQIDAFAQRRVHKQGIDADGEANAEQGAVQPQVERIGLGQRAFAGQPIVECDAGARIDADGDVGRRARRQGQAHDRMARLHVAGHAATLADAQMAFAVGCMHPDVLQVLAAPTQHQNALQRFVPGIVETHAHPVRVADVAEIRCVRRGRSRLRIGATRAQVGKGQQRSGIGRDAHRTADRDRFACWIDHDRGIGHAREPRTKQQCDHPRSECNTASHGSSSSRAGR